MELEAAVEAEGDIEVLASGIVPLQTAVGCTKGVRTMGIESLPGKVDIDAGSQTSPDSGDQRNLDLVRERGLSYTTLHLAYPWPFLSPSSDTCYCSS